METAVRKRDEFVVNKAKSVSTSACAPGVRYPVHLVPSCLCCVLADERQPLLNKQLGSTVVTRPLSPHTRVLGARLTENVGPFSAILVPPFLQLPAGSIFEALLRAPRLSRGRQLSVA